MRQLRLIFWLIAGSALAGCATAPKSDFREVSSIPESQSSSPVWNFCREGAASDQEGLKLHLNGSFVTTVYTSALLQSRLQVIGSPGSETLRIDAVRQNNSEYSVFAHTRAVTDSREVFVISESKTKSGMVLPLPGFVVTRFQGERNIRVVSQAEFSKFCSREAKKIYLK